MLQAHTAAGESTGYLLQAFVFRPGATLQSDRILEGNQKEADKETFPGSESAKDPGSIDGNFRHHGKTYTIISGTKFLNFSI